MTTDTTSSTTALRERGTAGLRVPADGDERLGGIQSAQSPAPLPERGAPPERSIEQRMSALETANDIRSHRAERKREIKAGRLSAEQLLADPKCASMDVIDLLLAMPKVGRVKAYKVLRDAGISPSKTIGGMSLRQRGELTRWFRGQSILPHRAHRSSEVRGKRIVERPDRGTSALLDDIRSVA